MRWKRSNNREPSLSPADGSLSVDSDTVTELYRTHVRMVHGYLRASGVADPEDLTSEVFVSMVRNLHTFRGDSDKFRSWLMTIAHRRLVDHRRQQARANVTSHGDLEAIERELAHLDRLPSDRPQFLDLVLVAGLAELTAEQREVLALRFLADLSLEEVSRITGRPVGAVKSMQRRALEALRRSTPELDDWRVGR